VNCGRILDDQKIAEPRTNERLDECLQLAALYPRLVPGGTLTFNPSDARSLLLPIDVEYATWANPRSECVIF
jgi:hypothetical protein